MSEYLCLLYEDEAPSATGSEELMAEVMAAHDAFSATRSSSPPTIVGGEALEPTTTATSARGGSEVTDGPFVETKEALGGFYLIDAPDLD